MSENGYERVFPDLSAHDDWWVLKSHLATFEPKMAVLPDIFQEFFETGLEQPRAGLAHHMSRLHG